MKTMEKLVNSNGSLKLGNHKVERGETDKYFYYWTCIVEVDHNKNQIIIDNGGFGTSSTTRAINSYLKELDYLDYEIIDKRK